METHTENTVQPTATTRHCVTDAQETEHRKQAVFHYQSTMSLARKMLTTGVISSQDYNKIDRIFAKKYGVSLCSIYRE
ncbi:MAG: hypothetical protein IJ766_00030 [Clostridia bacterium]|nr:hypothetical protein [Clostridia bacterium]